MKKLLISLLSVISAVVIVGTTVYASVNKAKNENSENNSLPIIIIDPGHGGFDSGCVASDGTLEKDINLSVSLVLSDIFNAFGCRTLLVRSSDISVESEGKTIRERKKSDIRNRFSLMKENPGCIYLSIHQNKYSSASAKGAQMFFTPDNLNSNQLAASIQSNISGKVQSYNKRKIKSCTKDVYIIHYAPSDSVAVLIECGFLSNKNELVDLKSSEYVERLCFAIACGVLEWADNKEDKNG